MSKNTPPKKKVIIKSKPSKKSPASKGKGTAKSSKASVSARRTQGAESTEVMLFGKQNFLWMGIGLLVMAFGFILMSGGAMPGADVWDENIIYSFRRITLAPILVLIGLIIEIYAIFKR